MEHTKPQNFQLYIIHPLYDIQLVWPTLLFDPSLLHWDGAKYSLTPST